MLLWPYFTLGLQSHVNTKEPVRLLLNPWISWQKVLQVFISVCVN